MSVKVFRSDLEYSNMTELRKMKSLTIVGNLFWVSSSESLSITVSLKVEDSAAVVFRRLLALMELMAELRLFPPEKSIRNDLKFF